MKPRDAYFDNLKWLLVLLVVVGHLIEPLPNNTALQPLYLTIYTFHIPLFVMVSGYFSKQLDNSKYTTRVISQLVVPYFIFESLYSLFDYAILGTSRLSFSYFTPYWLMWYFFSMIIWKAVLPFAIKLKYALPLSIAIAVLAGYAADAEYYASISRTLVFFPFFLAGYLLDKSKLDQLRTPGVRLMAASALGVMYAVYAWYGHDWNVQWLYGSYSYSSLGHPEWYAGVYRLLHIAVATFIGGCVLLLIPARRLPLISEQGKHTVYVYLLHGFVIKGLMATDFYSYLSAASAPSLVLVILLGLLLTLLLSSGRVTLSMSWLVEPRLERIFKGEKRRQWQ